MVDPDSGKKRTYYIGLLLILLAAGLWSLNGALIKLIQRQSDQPQAIGLAVSIAFYRSLIAGIFLAPFAWGKYHTLLPRTGERKWYVIRPAGLACVLFFALMTVFFVFANTMTKAANAIILQYTSTFWIFGLSPWLLKEKPSARDVPILLLAMVGIGIIFAENASTDLPGLMIALGSGLFYALLTLMIRMLRDSHSGAVTVMNNIGSAILILPAMFIFGSFVVPTSMVVLLLILGVIQFGLPYYFYSLGLARVPAPHVAIITMIEPVLVPVWAYWAVQEIVSIQTMAGGAIILVAVLLAIFSAHEARKRELQEAVVHPENG